jgi:hypothetical protein
MKPEDLELAAFRQLRTAASLRRRGAMSPEDFLAYVDRVLDPVPASLTPGAILHGGNGGWSGISDPGWLVRDLLPREPALAILYGESGAWKSFLALDLGLALSSGASFLPPGLTAQGDPPGWSGGPELVLYLAAEDSTWRLKKRLLHLAAFRGMDGWPGLDVRPSDRSGPLLLSDHAARRKLAGYVASEQIALVIVDTLAESVRGISINTERDASLVVDWSREIRESGATVLLIAHTRKPPASTSVPFDATDPDNVRGSSVLRGAADVMFASARLGEHELRFVIRKSRILEGNAWRDLVVGINPEPGDGASAKFVFSRDLKAINMDRKIRREEGIQRVVAAVAEIGAGQTTASAVAEKLGIKHEQARGWLTDAAKRALLAVESRTVGGSKIAVYRTKEAD